MHAHAETEGHGESVVLWPSAGGWAGEGVEARAGVSMAVMAMVWVLRDVIDYKCTKPRGSERGKLGELSVESRAAAEETKSRRNPRAFICLA